MRPEWDKQEIEQTFGPQVEEVFNQYNTIDETFIVWYQYNLKKGTNCELSQRDFPCFLPFPIYLRKYRSSHELPVYLKFEVLNQGRI